MSRRVDLNDIEEISAIADQALDACEFIEGLEGDLAPQFGKVSRRYGALYHLYQAHLSMHVLADELRFIKELEETTS